MREIGYGVISNIAVKGEDQATELGAGLIGQDALLHGAPECTPGITAYPDLTDKPRINSVELVGDKSLTELGIEPKRGADDNYVTALEKQGLHTHDDKGILDYLTGPIVAAWNSAVSWVNEVGAAHIVNYLNPHKTSFANIEGYPAVPSGKVLKDDGTFAALPSGGGGSGSPLYLSNADSDIPGYKKLSYTPDAVEVVKTITANNSTVYGETYIFDLPIDISVINAGQWVFDYWRSVSSAALESYARIESFLRHTDGTETTTYSVESPSIEDTALTQRIITYTLQQFTVLPTDRFGVRMSFMTTRNANTVYSYIVGGLRGHSITTPVPPRYEYLRDKPRINNVELVGDKSLFELGIEPKRGVDDFYVSATEKSRLDRLLVDFTVPSDTPSLTFDRDKNGVLFSALEILSCVFSGIIRSDNTNLFPRLIVNDVTSGYNDSVGGDGSAIILVANNYGTFNVELTIIGSKLNCYVIRNRFSALNPAVNYGLAAFNVLNISTFTNIKSIKLSGANIKAGTVIRIYRND